MNRLLEKYNTEIRSTLIQELGYDNLHAAPAVKKVVLNMGVGKAIKDKKEVLEAQEDLTKIAGQKAIITTARKSIAGFGVGKGASIGTSVTLRGRRMYEFLDKLFSIILPRTRDFRGLKVSAFDGAGNYTLGIEEQVVFPEIDANSMQRRRGLQVVIVTTAKNNEEGEKLLRALGLPLEKDE